MKPANSIGALNSHNSDQLHHQQKQNDRLKHPATSNNGKLKTTMNSTETNPTSPICRCRVMYLGSAVPHVTKDGLQGIQEPLKELYPDSMSLASGNAGIDSWLSVWSNGVLIENIDENGQEVKKFFQIEALHYCAAVKYVSTSSQQQNNSTKPYANNHQRTRQQESFQFAPLDSPLAHQSNLNHPPIFACILRRTTGIKVLECHAFICKREPAANALVRCCFHAYADTVYANQLNNDFNNNDIQQTKTAISNQVENGHFDNNAPILPSRKSKSMAALNEPDEQSAHWTNVTNNHSKQNKQQARDDQIYGEKIYRDYSASSSKTLQSQKSSKPVKLANERLLLQNQKLSKSMHHLQDYNQNINDQSLHYANQQIHDFVNRLPPHIIQNQPPFYPTNEPQLLSQMPPQMLNQSFYNPLPGRSFGNTSNGGTLKSIKSLAANSIAATLLKSKKHAKTMSMAQMNPAIQQQNYSNTFKGVLNPFMPHVPPMFSSSFPLNMINGSQTMKAPSKSMMQSIKAQQSFETMSSKEAKKLRKKSAKYGGLMDPSLYTENGLPLFLPPPIPHVQPPFIPPPQAFSMMLPQSKSGTMISQHRPQMDQYGSDMPDFMNQKLPRHPMDLPIDPLGLPPPPRTILVKPDPEFLKSKAGKKWIKQQKEFKKLLPPHLEGLPIVFGPPPPEALQSTLPKNPSMQPIVNHNQMPIPPLDVSGIYNNPNTFNGAGRISSASTLARFSPHSQYADDGFRRPSHPYDYDHQERVRGRTENGDLSDQRRYNSDESSVIMPNSECSAEIYRHPVQRSRSKSSSSHMVEQKTICLGDEIDGEDEEIRDNQLDSFGCANDRRNYPVNEKLSKQYSAQTLHNINDQRHYEQLDGDYRNNLDHNGHFNNIEKQRSDKNQQFYNVPYDQDGYSGNNISKGYKTNGLSKNQLIANGNGQVRDIDNLNAQLQDQLNLKNSYTKQSRN